jgi:preprotein translocase subunit SecD
MSHYSFLKKQQSYITQSARLITVCVSLELGLAACLPSQEISDKARCPFKGVEITLQVKPPAGTSGVTTELNNAVKKVLKERITGLGVSAGSAIETISQEQLLIQLPGVNDPQQAERVLGNVGELDFRKQKPGTEAQLSIELQVRAGLVQKQAELRKTGEEKALAENQKALDRSNEAIAKLFEGVNLSGKNLKDAGYQPTQADDRWEVTLRFDAQGAEAFTQLTKDLAGTGRSIGIFFDNVLLSSPVVGPEFAQTGISGGSAVITGNFTAESAQELGVQLRSGALPAPLEVLSVRKVENNQCTP